MPAQATITSKTLNQHNWGKQNIPGQNQIQTIPSYQPSPTEDSRRKTPTQGGCYTKKIQEINLLSTHSREDSHMNLILLLTTKITESNNHWSLIPLNINRLISSIKRHRITVCIQKQDPAFFSTEEMHLNDENRHYLRV